MDITKLIKEEYVNEMSDLPNLYCPDLPNGIRVCEWVNINQEWNLSVQASALHYCTPRALVPLENYTCFEVAVIKGGVMCPWEIALEEMNVSLDHFNFGDILGYVPKHVVEKIYKFMMEKYNV